MQLSDFTFNLPDELIAQTPIEPRDHSRLMVVDRESGSITHDYFYNIGKYLDPTDLVVANNSKVIPARLFGAKVRDDSNPEPGAQIEILLIERVGPLRWKTMAKPGRRLKVGNAVELGEGWRGTVEVKKGDGSIVFKFERNKTQETRSRVNSKAKNQDSRTNNEAVKQWNNENQQLAINNQQSPTKEADFLKFLHKNGHMPTPPYIKETLQDKNRYQTVYAEKEGSVAAPTAGLHFTPELIKKLQARGNQFEYVDLHVDWGTFQPIRSEEIEKHHMHEEYFEVSQEVLEQVIGRTQNNKKITAVGTTSVRVLESITNYESNPRTIEPLGNNQQLTTNNSPYQTNTPLSPPRRAEPLGGASKGGSPLRQRTDIFIYPGYQFRNVDHLITNFHTSKSSLLCLVSAFMGNVHGTVDEKYGMELWRKSYAEAIKEKYRFFSFGDAMYIR
jgi:S-adenosylmethionine:tRNA ribosyltransferase-isomerase